MFIDDPNPENIFKSIMACLDDFINNYITLYWDVYGRSYVRRTFYAILFIVLVIFHSNVVKQETPVHFQRLSMLIRMYGAVDYLRRYHWQFLCFGQFQWNDLSDFSWKASDIYTCDVGWLRRIKYFEHSPPHLPPPLPRGRTTNLKVGGHCQARWKRG